MNFKYLLIVITSVLFTTHIHSQSQEFDFEEFYNKVSSLISNNKPYPALDLLNKVRKEEFDELDCNQKALYYTRYAKLAFNYVSDQAAITTWKDSAIVTWHDCLNYDKEMYAMVHHNLAIAHSYGQQHNLTGSYYEKATQLMDSLEGFNKSKLCNVLLGAADHYSNINDLYKSNLYFDRAKNLLKSINDPNLNANYYRKKCIYHFSFEEYKLAINNGLQSNKIYNLDEEKNKQSIINNYLNIASSYYYLDSIKKSKVYLDTVQSIYKKYNSKISLNNYNNLSLKLLSKSGKNKEAISKYIDNIKKEEKKKNHNVFAIAAFEENIADAYLEENNYREAHNYYNKSIKKYYLKNIDHDLILNEINLMGCLDRKALAYKKEYEEKGESDLILKSLDLYKRIDTIFNKSRVLKEHDLTKLYLIKKVKSYLSNAVEISINLYKSTKNRTYLNEAYQYASKSKAILLNEGSKAVAAMHNLLPDTLILTQDKLSQSIDKLTLNIQNSNDTKETDSLFISYRNLLAQYNQHLQSVKKKYPQYYKLKHAKIKLPSIIELQSKLKKSEVLLDFYITDDKIRLFTISSKNSNVAEFDKDSIHINAISNFRKSIEHDRNIDSNSNKELIKLLPQIKDQHEHIIIIPDEELNTIAFEALKIDNKFLIEKKVVSYLNSNLQLHNTNPTKQESAYIGFGTNYSSKLNNNINAFYKNDSLSLTQLKFAKNEISETSKYWNGDVFLGSLAAKNTFLKKAKNYKILHLALHGILNNLSPDYSSLIFDDKTKDNILTTSEIYRANLNNELVILSACNSSNGKLYKGEGVKSLARGFMFAGCSSVVSSLWAAYDKPTSEIITSFNKYLSEGQNKAKALQMAKKEYLKKTFETNRSPKNWANLILIGSTVPIQSESFFANPKSILLIGIFILLILFLTRRFISPNN